VDHKPGRDTWIRNANPETCFFGLVSFGSVTVASDICPTIQGSGHSSIFK
jgi:hypothetical protein